MVRFHFRAFSVLVAGILPATAADKITYNDNILPIFRNACLNCHNPDKKKAGLDLSTYQATLQGSENGKVLQSGNPSGSLLFKCIKGIEDPKMPPKGDKVSDGDIAIIEKWIVGQLLETATGKAVAASNNKVETAVVSLTRPDGPPPMPGELPMEPVVRTKTANALTALAVSPWAPLVAVGGQKQIVLYHTETLDPLGVLPFPEGFPAIIKFSRNGQILLTGGGLGGKSGRVALWDIKTGDRIGTVGNEFDQVLAADLSADQQFVALGGPNKIVKIFATKDGKLITSIKKHTDWVTAIAFSPDGKYLASADRNGGIQVWEGATGKEFNVLPGHKVMVTGLAFMTGVLASCSEDGTIVLWDVKEAKEIRKINAHAGGVAWVDFTPDGRLVSCGRDKIAKAWDQTGKELGKTQPFADIALRAGLSNDRIIAGDWAGTIRVCAFDGKPIGELTANPPTLFDRITQAEKRLAEAQTAAPMLQQQVAALEQKVSAENAALETAKALPAQLEKRLADESARLAQVPEAERAAAQTKIDSLKAEIATARADLQTRLGVPAKPATDELNKKLAQQTERVAKLREERATKTEGTPEYASADAKVQAKKKEIEQTQAALAEASKAPPAAVAAKPNPAEEELAKARPALEQANTQITAAKAELDRWKLAQLFQTVHNAKRTLADKQTHYEALVQAAKEALAPAEKVQSDIAAAEKALADAPAKLMEKETLLADARRAVEPASKAVGALETALAQKEKALADLTEARKKAGDAAGDLGKKLEAQTAEVAKLRETRAAQTEGTPAYDEANSKVQAKKAEIAQTEAALVAVKEGKPNAEAPELKTALAEVTQSKEALEKARAAAKAASETAIAAELAVTAAQKVAEQGTQQLAELRKKMPEVIKHAHSAKAAAELAAAAAEKELAAAKVDVEKRRAAYDVVKSSASKASASL